MGLDIVSFNELAKLKHAELLQEAEQERLANRVAGPGRPVRSYIADLLLAVAARLDSQAIAHAEA